MFENDPQEYALEIIRKEFDKALEIYEVISMGTTTKNYSFIVKEFGEPKYFLKLHAEGKPLREKKSTEFYTSNEIVETQKIYSIGKDYTLTFFEKNLEEPTFPAHVLNLADFHYNLINTDHGEIASDDIFNMISRKDFFNFVSSKEELLENAVSSKKFYSLLLNLPSSEDLGMESILIHGDPHRQNLLTKKGNSFFLDLEHTRYSIPTVDLARVAYNYPPSELENILALYTSFFDSLPGGLSKKDFIAGTISDILLDGASSIVTCQFKKLRPELTKNWINKFRNYFDYLSNSV